VRGASGAGAVLVLLLAVGTTPALPFHPGKRGELNRVNVRLHGTVIDHTHNHGADRRIWSAALNEPRDLYVYLPPGYDPSQAYPVMILMHAFGQDEKSFLYDHLAERFDEAIADGELPPLIIAAPDGSLDGYSSFLDGGSFFINSKAGNFEDYLIQDVWGFLLENYPIRPEREAHILAGPSMGGFAAYNLGIKYRETFKIVVGLFPPVNLRYVDCHQRYRTNFDPCCWDWRTRLRRHEVVGRFFCYLVPVREKFLTDPLFGRRDREAINMISRENPIEMLEAYDLQEGQLSMYIGYGGRDEYNIDAQVESFLYVARQRGLTVTVGYEPNGRHNLRTALRLMPDALAWLAPQIAPYSPPLVTTGCILPADDGP
jgi:S-formylglutathione hydrolase FrmB